jgi:hypothetical protein
LLAVAGNACGADALRDWNGLWQMAMPAPPAGGAPPATDAPRGPPRMALAYNTEWQARMEAVRARLAAVSGEEQIPDNTVTECSWGVPRLFTGPYMFEIVMLPDQVFMNYDVNEFRHIWTDGRVHPRAGAQSPSNTGHSIAQWQGNALLVDTVTLRPLWLDSEGATLSARAHLVERWSEGAPGVLLLEVTLDDPEALTAPYHFTRSYRRVTDTNRMLQQNCHENTHEVQQGDKVITQFAAPSARP